MIGVCVERSQPLNGAQPEVEVEVEIELSVESQYSTQIHVMERKLILRFFIQNFPPIVARKSHKGSC